MKILFGRRTLAWFVLGLSLLLAPACRLTTSARQKTASPGETVTATPASAGETVRSSASPAQAGPAESMARSVTIIRDSFGVPHVTGPTDASCVFGYIYAQAEDNFWQVEDNIIAALGRAAEVHGEAALPGDVWCRAFEVNRLSQEEYRRAAPGRRALWDAWAAGLNEYLARHPALHPRLIDRFEPWHVLALSRYALYKIFVSDVAGLDLKELVAATEAGRPAAALRGTGERQAEARSAAAWNAAFGSNSWAIGPSKSASGHPMLFINPHLGFFGATQLYEGHLRSDEGWDISGASLLGLPFPALGHNDRLGWSHTVNLPDIADFYAERFDDSVHPDTYRYGTGTRTATGWRDTIVVRTPSGRRERAFAFRKTHHGPIVAVRDGRSIAARLAKYEEGGQLDEWYAMGKAQSLAEFRTAMSSLAIPMFNTLYADRDGNIFYLYNGAVPRRSSRFDWEASVDGSDPETDWKGYHPLSDLPQILNPASGFLQNCNSSPFTTTATASSDNAATSVTNFPSSNPVPGRFPPYMVHDEDTPRAEMSRRILSGRKTFTLAEWTRAAMDTRVLEAESLVPRLTAEWDKLKDADPARAARTADAIAELRAWDGVSTTASTAMTLFVLWFQRAEDPEPEEKQAPWRNVAALEDTLAGLEKDFGSGKVPWGEINRLQRTPPGSGGAFSDDRPSLPVAGAPGDVGIIYSFNAAPAPGQKRHYGRSGNSYVSVVEFGPRLEARSVLVFGESADPASPHYFDQAELYARGEFKPAWFDIEEVRQHAERSYHPGE